LKEEWKKAVDVKTTEVTLTGKATAKIEFVMDFTFPLNPT